jgi:hypothetical protein
LNTGGAPPPPPPPPACREGRDTSPLTNKLLAHKLLMPCQTMKLCVEEAAAYIRAVQQQVL